MKEVLHVRVFELKCDKYQLPTSFMTLEEYVTAELLNDYVVTDMANFGIDNMRVITHYSPAAAKKFIAAGGMVSNLAEVPKEEV